MVAGQRTKRDFFRQHELLKPLLYGNFSSAAAVCVQLPGNISFRRVTEEFFDGKWPGRGRSGSLESRPPYSIGTELASARPRSLVAD